MRWSLLAILICVLGAGAAYGQPEDACRIKDVTIEPLSNGVRIRLKADGLISLSSGPGDFWENHGSGWHLAEMKRLAFTLNKVEGGAAALVPVNVYPVSHLEFSARPPRNGNARLCCTLVLYQEGALTVFRGDDDEWDQSWSGRYADIPQVALYTTQQRNEVLIMVTSDKQPEQPAAAASPGASPSLSVSGQPDSLTMRAVNVELGMVAAGLAQQTDTPIMLEGDSRVRVTAYLRDMPLDRLLAALARSYGLSVSRMDGSYRVHIGPTGDPSTDPTMVTRSVPLHYLDPETAQHLLPDLLLPAVKPNISAHAVSVTGSPAVAEKIAADLQTLDQPSYQCLVRAWVVSIEDDDSDLRDLLLSVGGGTVQATASSAGDLQVAVGERPATELLADIQALAERRKIRLRAAPLIRVANGQEGELFMGEDVYYWTLSSGDSQDLRLSSVRAGTRLRVRPLTGGEWVTADVRVESNFVQEINTLGPLVQRQSTDSTVRVRSGDTIIIGGLQLVTDDQQRRRPLIPLLRGRQTVRAVRHVWVLLSATAEAPRTNASAPFPEVTP